MASHCRRANQNEFMVISSQNHLMRPERFCFSMRTLPKSYDTSAFRGVSHMKLLIVPAICGLFLLVSVPARADATKNCHTGSYRLSDGQTLDIAPSDGDTLRWRAFTGETG